MSHSVTLLACLTCAQDRGPATLLIGAISLLPLLLASAVALYVRRIAHSASHSASHSEEDPGV